MRNKKGDIGERFSCLISHISSLKNLTKLLHYDHKAAFNISGKQIG